MPPSQSEFLNDPSVALARGEEIPAEWLHRAWVENEDFRADVVYELAKSVGHHGTFEDAELWVKALPPALSAEEAAELYSDVFEQSQRLEHQWRPAFVAAFPSSAPLLPPPHDVEMLAGTIEQQILLGFADGFEDAVRTLVLLPGGTAALRQRNENGDALIDLAERLGRGEMAAVIRAALDQQPT